MIVFDEIVLIFEKTVSENLIWYIKPKFIRTMCVKIVHVFKNYFLLTHT